MQVQGIRGPDTKLMATLALINAAILLISVLMAQHALLNRLRSFLWSTRPLHAAKQWVDNALASGSGVITRRLRTGSIAFATGLAILHTLATAGFVLVQWREQVAISDDYIWAHTGFGSFRVGLPAAAANTAMPVQPATNAKGEPVITLVKTPRATSQLISLELPDGVPPQVPVAAIEEINQRGDIPVLSWNADDKFVENRVFQRKVLQLIARENQLLLRPVFKATNPTDHRSTWQRLVKSYRATGDTTVVWVWTPPRPDSIANYFPGAAHVTWVASDCRATPATAALPVGCYIPFRQQVAAQIEMQSKPILLLVPQPFTPTSYPLAKKLENRYPEVRAVLFSGPAAPASTAKAARRPKASGSLAGTP
jgi:cellulose synthase (UDP-forming)